MVPEGIGHVRAHRIHCCLRRVPHAQSIAKPNRSTGYLLGKIGYIVFGCGLREVVELRSNIRFHVEGARLLPATRHVGNLFPSWPIAGWSLCHFGAGTDILDLAFGFRRVKGGCHFVGCPFYLRHHMNRQRLLAGLGAQDAVIDWHHTFRSTLAIGYPFGVTGIFLLSHVTSQRQTLLNFILPGDLHIQGVVETRLTPVVYGSVIGLREGVVFLAPEWIVGSGHRGGAPTSRVIWKVE